MTADKLLPRSADNAPRRRSRKAENALLAELGIGMSDPAEAPAEAGALPEPDTDVFDAPAMPHLPDPTPQEIAEIGRILAKLHPRHARFVQLYVSGRRPAESARLAGFSDSRRQAKILLARHDVAAAVEALNGLATKRSLYDFDQASAELAAAAEFAKRTGNGAALVKAIETRAKLHGFLSDKLTLDAPGAVSFNFVMNRLDEASADAPPMIEHSHD